MDKTTDVLLCYRGRFQAFVRALAEALRKSDLRVAFDREILAEPASASDLHLEVEWVSVGGLSPPTERFYDGFRRLDRSAATPDRSTPSMVGNSSISWGCSMG